ncbi:MAG TPA: alpha/beta fold hydrolase [Gemmataceae bacterium]|nr:alpha/beta fold hydrolase [Gemmataceae bacterium]
MPVELVRTTTSDGLTLDGAWQPASPAELTLDAACVVHGTGSNFYSSTFMEMLAANLHGLGISVARINTRGHDGVSTAVTALGPSRQGAAFEAIDDCRHDLAGWAEWIRKSSGARLLFLGHSMGALKCLYAAAVQASLKPAAIVAISPPHLSYEHFCRSAKADVFRETYRRAERLAASENPGLMEVQFPLPMFISPAGYVEKYGPDERYNLVRFVSKITCPVLFLFGQLEVEQGVAFQRLPEELRKLKVGSVEIIAGADHFYTGVRPAAWAAIEKWFQTLIAEPDA